MLAYGNVSQYINIIYIYIYTLCICHYQGIKLFILVYFTWGICHLSHVYGNEWEYNVQTSTTFVHSYGMVSQSVYCLSLPGKSANTWQFLLLYISLERYPNCLCWGAKEWMKIQWTDYLCHHVSQYVLFVFSCRVRWIFLTQVVPIYFTWETCHQSLSCLCWEAKEWWVRIQWTEDICHPSMACFTICSISYLTVCTVIYISP